MTAVTGPTHHHAGQHDTTTWWPGQRERTTSEEVALPTNVWLLGTQPFELVLSAKALSEYQPSMTAPSGNGFVEG